MSTAPEHVRYRRLRRAWEVGVFVVAALLLAYSWPHSDRAVREERANLYLTAALAEETIALDGPISDWGAIEGLAEHDGRALSDGAIGPALVAAPAYLLATSFKDVSAWRVRDLVDLQRTWTWLLLSLLGLFCLRRILELKDLESAVVDVASLTWITGTAAFYWGGMFTNHQLTAVTSLLALYCLARAEDRIGNVTEIVKWSFFAGLAAGFLCLADYPATLLMVGFLIYIVIGDERLRTRGFIAFVAGAAPSVWAFTAYHSAAFGGALELPHFHLIDPEAVARMGMPDFAGVWSNLFSSSRGVLFMSPFAVLGLWGLWAMWEEGRQRLAVLCSSASLLYVAVAAASPVSDWAAAAVVPALALWFVPVAFGYQAACYHPVSEAIGKGLAIVSILGVQSVAAFVTVMPAAGHPWMDCIAASRAEGLVAPNLGRSITELPAASLYPLALLTLLVVGLVAFRGMRSIGTTSKLIHLGGIAACLLVAATVLAAGGDDWTTDERDEWLQDVKRWDAREFLGAQEPEAVPDDE